MATNFVRLLIRRGSASQWAGANPILQSGEPAIETDAARIRVGDGTNPFNALRAFLSVPQTAIAAAQALLNATTALAQRTALGFTADIADLNDVATISADGWTFITAPTVNDQRQLLGLNDTDSIGALGFFYGTSAPTGWLKANGAAVSRTTYAALFAKYGTTFGAGNGTTTFNLPDMRGKFPRAFDDGAGVDAGRVVGSDQAAYAGQVPRDGWGTAGGAPNPGTSITAGRLVVGSGGTEGGETLESLRAAGGVRDVTPGDARPINMAWLACVRYAA